MAEFSHIDKDGRACMVNVGAKPLQHRSALAKGSIDLQPETVRLIRENLIKKGDVLTVAEIAGVQAAKNTSSLIPLCHPLSLTLVKVSLALSESGVNAEAIVECNGQTGVEMEALTAVSVALLTVYDMCKAVDKNMTIGEIKLVSKTKSEII